MTTEPPDPPPTPLDMTEKEVKRVMKYLSQAGLSDEDIRDRLLIEILDCLRRIEDKLDGLGTGVPR